MEYVYVLQSLKDRALYIGHTNDLKRRVAEHKSGKVPSTKPRLPVRLVYYEACNILDDAIRREAIQDRFWQGISQQEIK